MKYLFGATMLSAFILGLTGVSSAQGIKHFRGYMCIYSVSPTCAAPGYRVGACTIARFTPPNFPGNPNSTSLAIFWGDYAQHFHYPTGSLAGATFRPVNFTGTGTGNLWTYTSQMRVVSQVPANPTTSLTTTVLADINGYEGTCNVRIRFTGQIRP